MPDTPRFSPSAPPRRIDVVAFPDVQLLDVAGPLQAFASANDIVRRHSNVPLYAPRVISAVGEPGSPASAPITTSAGLALLVHPLPGPDDPPDTLIVAGGWGVHEAVKDPMLLAWLRAQAARSRRVASVCTGAFLLAAAGLLDNRRAVTHWTRCNELARRFPAVRVEADPIFIRDDNVWTSAGITSGIDLALALIEADHGRALALDVARQLVVFLKRPGGQSQFSAALSLQSAGDRFGELNAWIADNLAGDLSVTGLAQRAGMSERSFVRHYRADTGMTPARAVEQLRVEAARRLLADTALSVKRVAARCGFGSEETMRRSFLRLIAATPQSYRERFAVNAPT
jgi:transcriptional regulator GlxA family with amidase domain